MTKYFKGGADVKAVHLTNTALVYQQIVLKCPFLCGEKQAFKLSNLQVMKRSDKQTHYQMNKVEQSLSIFLNEITGNS